MTLRMVKDHIGRGVKYAYPPRRIVCLCPSITETLFALGLGDEVVGRTRYCRHPKASVRKVARVGGTKEVDYETIDKLKPDLILCEKEENTKEMVEALERKYPVYVAEVKSYEDALRMITDIGAVTGREGTAEELVQGIRGKFAWADNGVAGAEGEQAVKAAYVIWKKPYMVAGDDTYINSMLEKCGFVNVFKTNAGRYPSVEMEDFAAQKPDVIFLSSEPFPFKESHQREFMAAVPGAKVLLVDGEMFWYGARMLMAGDYMRELAGRVRLEKDRN